MKTKKIIWLTLGIYLIITGFLILQWFNGFLIWQPILLLLTGFYCIIKSKIITKIWDAIFPDEPDWDDTEIR